MESFGYMMIQIISQEQFVASGFRKSFCKGFDENNSSKQQKFREFLHFLHTKFREFLRKKATSRCFFSKKFREFLLRKMAKIPGILKKNQCAQKLQVFLL